VSNDQMAIGVVHALVEAGLSVPGDVSVVGFDDIPEAEHLMPPLTTVSQDFGELGRNIMATLVDILRDGSEVVTPLLEPPVVVRASTAPPS
jgi:DNA-binding LacI/PurR family transcriptional regulator